MIGAIVAIVYAVFNYIALYNVFKDYAPNNAVLYLVLSLLVGGSDTVILFIIRNKMPVPSMPPMPREPSRCGLTPKRRWPRRPPPRSKRPRPPRRVPWAAPRYPTTTGLTTTNPPPRLQVLRPRPPEKARRQPSVVPLFPRMTRQRTRMKTEPPPLLPKIQPVAKKILEKGRKNRYYSCKSTNMLETS